MTAREQEIAQQGKFFRRLQLIGACMLFSLVVLGLCSINCAVIIYKTPKAELTEMYLILGGLIGSFTGGFIGFLFGTSIGSAKSNEAMRESLRVGQVEEKKPE